MRSQAGSIIMLVAMAGLLLTFTAYGQEFDTSEWTWKEGRDEFARIVAGEYSTAVQHLRTYMQAHPDNQEVLFSLATAYAQRSDMDLAMEYVRAALDAGLPVERFLAGPRSVTLPLTDSSPFQEFLADRETELLHGPLLGDVTDTTARFWVRTYHEVPVRVVVSSEASPGSVQTTGKSQTDARQDYTAAVEVNGLQPATKYSYQLEVDGELLPDRWTFHTFPGEGSPARFRIGFGGGSAYEPMYEHMWATIDSHNLDAFLTLGDNVYIDHPEMPAVQRYCYYRRQSSQNWRMFTAGTPVYAIWDDHDFTTNDGWGGPAVETPGWKRSVWRIFRQNWNNPSYGGGEAQPGCWYDFTIGDVHFIMLDGRYYRTDPNTEDPSMLGPVQKRWLLNTLQESAGTFKVIASPVPWAEGTKPGSKDTWDGYAAEREEIFSFIEEHKINGIILLSADRHRSDAWRIEREKGYPLYEFESSRLTNIHFHRLIPGRIFGYNEKPSFGIVSFDTTQEDPGVSYEIYNIDNTLIHKLTLRKSQISFPRD